MQLHFAGNDVRLNAAGPPHGTALKAAGMHCTGVVCPDTEHGFNTTTTPRHDRGAAALAWQRTRALFKRSLAG